MECQPQDLSVAERYKLLIGSITPRPIAFVSTVSPDGHLNIAPFSFFTAVGSNPMQVLFCPANAPDGGEKDTLRNAKMVEDGGQGEFVVNVVSESFARQMAAAAEPLPADQSEFDFAGLSTESSSEVQPPRLAESPVSFECRTVQVIRTNPGAPGGGNVVMGEVVHVRVIDDAVNERMHVDPAVIQTIGRMGGMSYCRTGDRFEMPMGAAALESMSE